MKRLIGGLLMAAGILIAGLSGLCSLVMLVSMLGSSGAGELIMLVLVFGGLPFAVGLALAISGGRMLRCERRKDDAGDF
jgi:hypothetical protein